MNKVKFLIAVIPAILFAACSDSVLEPPQEVNGNPATEKSTPGMQRVVVNSREELKLLMDELNASDNSDTRVADHYNISLSENEEGFVSLLEANKQKYFATLTESEKAIIANDPDGLEFCLSDSVIADYQFSCLLNAKREIQIGDTVYRFIDKGVGYTDLRNAPNLDMLDSLTRNLKHKPSKSDLDAIKLDKNITFRFASFIACGDTDYGAGGAGGYFGDGYRDKFPAASEGLTIEDGGQILYIKPADVREILYSTSKNGDESSLSSAWKNFFGIYISAFKYFSPKVKVNMNFYDQNYVIYSNIGTKLKLQKKVLGIWWNIKSKEMYHGWDMLTLKYDYPKVVTDYFPTNQAGARVTPTYMTTTLPTDEVNNTLLHIPFIEYDFSRKDLFYTFKQALKIAHDRLSSSDKNAVALASNNGRQGLFTHNEKNFYVMFGPNSGHTYNKKSMHSKFFSKWFPCDLSVSFEYSAGNFRLTGIHFDTNDHVELYRGIVWGAVKYDGRWLGVRIVKDIDKR